MRRGRAGTEDLHLGWLTALVLLGASFRGVCRGDGDPGQGEASKVAPVDKLSLVFVALFAVSLWGERPSVKEWVGIFMISPGVLVLALK